MITVTRSLPRRSARAFLGAVLAAAALVLTAIVAPVATPSAQAANLSAFQPGNIIGDAVFFDKNAMSQAQIQTFLQAKVPTCAASAVCLKDYYTTTKSIAADPMCGAYSGGGRERASAIIYKVAQACGVNPRVILVMLQKEQGLVTSVWPSTYAYNYAMGANCPDSSGCNGNSAGLFIQVYSGVWQLKRYANPPGTAKTFTWYAPGKTWNILYSPNTSCGRKSVYVANQATANLYYYTPYTPNAAALKAGYGTGDSCSSYGNRNFYNYFTDWFGSTQYGVFASAPTPTISGAAVAGQVLSANPGAWSPAPTSVAYQWLRAGSAISGATSAAYRITTDDAGKTLSVRVTVARSGYTSASATSGSTAAVKGFTVSRTSGSDRYTTAVTISKAEFPSTVGTVYLATGADYADALAAAPLAARQRAALLLTAPDSLPDVVAAELKRLAPANVVLIGGPGVLDDGTPDRVKAALSTVRPNVAVTRIGGADRFETSRLLAQAAGASANVYIVTGRDFPDALSAAAPAGQQNRPIILVDGSQPTLDAATVTLLQSQHVTSAALVGGPAVVSAGIATQLASLRIAVTRFGGADRYATNAAVIAGAYGSSNPSVYLATAMDYPDALTGSTLAAVNGAPLFLTRPTCLSSTAADFLKNEGGVAVTLLGGTGALSDAVAKLARC
ncbi:MAG: cell wall-binding repeat-containing protein [Microbacterium sp.]|nr:cell wall-binding repeat-containing protein [Microbacterium sp.]